MSSIRAQFFYVLASLVLPQQARAVGAKAPLKEPSTLGANLGFETPRVNRLLFGAEREIFEWGIDRMTNQCESYASGQSKDVQGCFGAFTDALNSMRRLHLAFKDMSAENQAWARPVLAAVLRRSNAGYESFKNAVSGAHRTDIQPGWPAVTIEELQQNGILREHYRYIYGEIDADVRGARLQR